MADEEDARRIGVGLGQQPLQPEGVVFGIVDRESGAIADRQRVVSRGRQPLPEPRQPGRITLLQPARPDDDARPPAAERGAVQDRRLRTGAGLGEGQGLCGHGRFLLCARLLPTET